LFTSSSFFLQDSKHAVHNSEVQDGVIQVVQCNAVQNGL
jgi:hypothetical protein